MKRDVRVNFLAKILKIFLNQTKKKYSMGTIFSRIDDFRPFILPGRNCGPCWPWEFLKGNR